MNRELREFDVELTQSEMAEYGHEAAEKRRRIKELQDTLAATRTHINGDIKVLEREAERLEHCQLEGKDSKSVPCFWRLDFDAGSAFLIRGDTGETVDSRALTDDDRQTSFLEPPEEPEFELDLKLDGALEIRCPVCEEPAGAKCVSAIGDLLGASHEGRVKAWKKKAKVRASSEEAPEAPQLVTSSRKNQAPNEKAAQSVACPVCGAEVGASCVSATGVTMNGAWHSERIEAAGSALLELPTRNVDAEEEGPPAVLTVDCPKCKQPAGQACITTGRHDRGERLPAANSHLERFQALKRRRAA